MMVSQMLLNYNVHCSLLLVIRAWKDMDWSQTTSGGPHFIIPDVDKHRPATKQLLNHIRARKHSYKHPNLIGIQKMLTIQSITIPYSC